MHRYDTGGKPTDQRYSRFLESIEFYNHTSQFGEDALIEAVFKRIGTTNKWCAECGASDGLFFSNTRKLIEDDWNAVLIEADEGSYEILDQRYADNSKVRTVQAFVGSQPGTRLDDHLLSAGAPLDMDLLVIDVDGPDYYLFNAVMKYRPRVIMVEFNPNADRMFIPEPGGPGQAGIDALRYVAQAKGYEQICCTQVNLICIRRDLAHLLENDATQPAQSNISIAACMSTPRFGPLSTFDCILQGLAPFNIPLLRGEGAWWHHSLTRAIERALELKPTFILTIDYDSLFCAQERNSDIARLVCLLHDNPNVDIVVPLQMKREGGELLAASNGGVVINQPLVPITQGHFGLTLFRSSVFEQLAKPWFNDFPNDKGEWGENRVDSDIYFWRQCEKYGIKVALATDVVIGHGEYVVTFPSQELMPIYVPLNDWRRNGQAKPETAFDRSKFVVEQPKTIAALSMGD